MAGWAGRRQAARPGRLAFAQRLECGAPRHRFPREQSSRKPIRHGTGWSAILADSADSAGSGRRTPYAGATSDPALRRDDFGPPIYEMGFRA